MVQEMQAEMRSLLFFTEFYYPAVDSTGYYVTHIIHSVAQHMNAPVKVVCATPSHDEVPGYDNLEVIRVSVGKYDKNRIVQRAMKFAMMTLKLAIHAVRMIARGDVVVVTTNPPFMLFFMALLRKCRRFTFLLVVYDVFPDNLVLLGRVTKDSLLHRVLMKISAWAYSTADDIVVIGRDMLDIVRKKTADCSPAPRMHLIPNWANTEAIVPEPKASNPIVRENAIEDKVIFMFAGNVGRAQGIDNLIEAVTLCKHKNAAFLFIGRGALSHRLEELCTAKDRTNAFYLGPMPMSRQQEFLNACDVAIVSLGAGMYGLGVPSKAYFSMAAGKPLLLVADGESEIAQVIGEEDCGWNVPAESPRELAQMFEFICENRHDISYRGLRARAAVEHKYSERVVLRRYRELIDALMKQ